ncbi:TetR/AcrR family transcriptional regulator [Clostridium massiliamazoniense]|uniref:TetR/AcrR family transcriptional regulator n=1 Tax=Clostridium massiliamazoniense TaxID=1347366 RepID=UPI0006D7C139|nr:TetR/AcrR family transcriptional regulator [Clostridium massiliamazoniense]
MNDMKKTLGLRERKKLQTRNNILKVAWNLFEEKGFDNVKVAEIADGANISVKTLFTYFSSKESIIFAGENELINAIKSAFENRKENESLIEIERKLIDNLLDEEDNNACFESNTLIEIVSKTPSIISHLLIMWKAYEDELSAILEKDNNLNLSPLQAKLIAINLIAPFRLLFDLLIEEKLYGKLSKDAIKKELDDMILIVQNGINNL